MWMRKLGVAFATGAATVGLWAVGSHATAPATQLAQNSLAVDRFVGSPQRFDSRIDYRSFDARASAIMADPSMVGLSVAVIENGKIAFVKGYGATVAGGGEPVGAHTVFRWASLSKGVAATMVGDLVAAGRVSLAAPVASYATSLKLPLGNEQRATVDDLLSHRLGVVRNAFDSKLEAGQDPRLLRGQLATLQALCAPGDCHSYQNIAFDAASEIVTNVTGRPYRQVVAQRIFQPLGMTDASLSRAGLLASKSWARPHIGKRTLTVNDNYYKVPAAGGVNASILDLARWMQAQMGQMPAVISPNVLDTIHRPRVFTNRHRGQFNQAMGASQYSLGWRDYNYRGHRLIGHQGAVMGYRATVLFDPQRQSGIALLWNSQSGRPVGLQLELLDRLYGFGYKDWLGLDKAATIATLQDQPVD
ncbi:MAG: serine hydrolase domain-containing protein [Sphingomonadaceae bacterium]